MKPGIYYSAIDDEIALKCECCRSIIGHAIFYHPHEFEYICEFWGESTELERYREAVRVLQNQRDEALSHNHNQSLDDYIRERKRFQDRIDQILNAEVQE